MAEIILIRINSLENTLVINLTLVSFNGKKIIHLYLFVPLQRGYVLKRRGIPEHSFIGYCPP